MSDEEDRARLSAASWSMASAISLIALWAPEHTVEA
jgi:hypothetical protein